MSLVDYPLFSWVVVIHSLHVSSFQEAHHQEFIFPVQSASGIVYNLCCNPSDHRHFSATHVAIFRVVRTRIQSIFSLNNVDHNSMHESYIYMTSLTKKQFLTSNIL